MKDTLHCVDKMKHTLMPVIVELFHFNITMGMEGKIESKRSGFNTLI